MQSQTATVAQIRYRLAQIPEAVALLSFLFVFIFFAIQANHFLTPISFSNILTFASITGIVTIGVAVLMISGEFDLSVGSTFAVASFIYALLLTAGNTPIVALLIALLASAILGLINGLIVTFTGIPSFIATLGTLLAYRGIARALGGSDFARYTGEPFPLLNIMNARLHRLNDLFQPAGTFRVSTFWFIGIAIVVSILMTRTRYGNWTFAVGGNADAALAQGVAVKRVKVANFVLTGFLAGLAGVIQFSHRLSVDPLRGTGMELVAVAACVIGGVRLSGGYGTIFGAVIGMILLQTLEQGLVLMQVPIQIFQAVAGLIMIIAVVSNVYLSAES